jgi:uncharacterized radical SAM superfamily protein
MSNLSPQTIWNLKDDELLALLQSSALQPQSPTIHFYTPSFSPYKTKQFTAPATAFPTISVTGHTCALNCGHCGGKVLQTMHAATSPEALFTLASRLKAEGAVGCLVSGGCLPDGSVPLEGYMDVLARMRHELALTVFVHTGIVGHETALALKSAGIDAALIDVIGSEQPRHKATHLGGSVADYAASLQALAAAGLRVVPHVIAGLNEGHLDGEYRALQLINQIQPAALVIIAFMPIRGTAMEKTLPPKPIDVAKVVATARVMFPEVPLTLGCMRPKGNLRGETDILALQAGVDGVAFPSDAAVEYVQTRQVKTVFSAFCCAQIGLDCKGAP